MATWLLRERTSTNLLHRDGEALALIECVRPHPLDSGCGVDEERIATPTLALIDEAGCMPY